MVQLGTTAASGDQRSEMTPEKLAPGDAAGAKPSPVGSMALKGFQEGMHVMVDVGGKAHILPRDGVSEGYTGRMECVPFHQGGFVGLTGRFAKIA